MCFTQLEKNPLKVTLKLFGRVNWGLLYRLVFISYFCDFSDVEHRMGNLCSGSDQLRALLCLAASLSHRSFRLLIRSQNDSAHFGSYSGKDLAEIELGSPAIARRASKCFSKSGMRVQNAGLSPTSSILAISHCSISSFEGSVACPARTRAAATACHSNIRMPKPPVILVY